MKKRILVIVKEPTVEKYKLLNDALRDFKCGEYIILGGFKIASIDDDLIVLEESGTKDT